jgi:amino acid transporter
VLTVWLVVDLSVYPGNIFLFLLVIGVVIIRRRRKRAGLPRPAYRAWYIAIIFATLTNLYMLVAPWYPPSGGADGGDVSFWYGTYMVVGIGMYVFSILRCNVACSFPVLA